jgi:hypothetical protein
MPLPTEERLENINKALIIMLDELKDEPVWAREFEPDKPIFKDIFKTTWPDMEDGSMLKPQHTLACKRYALTGYGWYRAMELMWPHQKSCLEPLLGKLMATFKSHVDGRDEDAWVDCDDIAREADIAYGFVYNVVESNFIEYHLEKKGVQWYEGRSGHTIEIPSRFGLPLL